MSAATAPGRQLSIQQAIQVAEHLPAKENDSPEPEPDALADDRVVDAERATCRRHPDRPAGADGLCTACRMELNGHAIGNHGRRL